MFTISPATPDDIPALADLWNAAFGPEFPATERLLRQPLEHDKYLEPGGNLVARDGVRIVGWVLSKSMAHVGEPMAAYRGRGGIGAICVHPEYQRRGIGSLLADRAEAHILAAGSKLGTLYFPHHLLPGIPIENAPAIAFFKNRGYTGGGKCHDLWRDLTDYAVPDKVWRALEENPDAEIRPALLEEKHAIQEMVTREFSAGWSYSTHFHFAHGGRASDVIVLVERGEIVGFCHTVDFTSSWLLPSVYWHELLGPLYGGLGPIGLAKAHRGRGLGLALTALAVQDLKKRGVARMGIDWTGILDFYGQLGFTVWKTYSQVNKVVGG